MTTEKREPHLVAEAPAPRLDDETYAAVAAAVAPYLRAQLVRDGVHRAAEAGDLDQLTDARVQDVLDALHAAGLLVFGDHDDRRHLRASWAAMSTALIHLSQGRRLSPEVLTAVPLSHRFYLMGHEAGHDQLAAAWRRMFAARELGEVILRRGTVPTPAEVGAIVAQLGGQNPYAEERPADADPWWGCWVDPAAVPAPFAWERYERTIDPDAHLDGLGDLCRWLGGTWAETIEGSSVTAMILRLIVKTQATPDRYAAVSRAFPREAAAWRVWMALSPSPTARELYEELVAAEPASWAARRESAALALPARWEGTATDADVRAAVAPYVAAGVDQDAARRRGQVGDPGDRVYDAALAAAHHLGQLVRSGVLAEDHPAVAAAVVAADGLVRIRAGEPEPARTDAEAAAALLAGKDPQA